MLIVGLTGGVGSGKSTVADLFAEAGARVIDADVIAREVIEPGTEGFDEVVACFGPEIVDGDGRVDRRRLAGIVFSDDSPAVTAARRSLERIIHPKVRATVGVELSSLSENAFVVLVVPLLIESGEYPHDKVVVVDCQEEVAVERLMRSRGWTIDQARARMGAQLSRAERNASADYVIDNDGDPDELRACVASCLDWLSHNRPFDRSSVQ